MPALNAVLSGLRAFQQKVDTAANNIANANTTGFKRSRASLAESFYQTQRAPSSQQPIGIQIGSGVQTSTIGTVQNQGSLQQTGSATDLALSGDGFFVVRDSGGQLYFTRGGDFTLDRTGNLVNSLGMHVRGVIGNASSDTGDAPDPGANPPTTVGDINIPSSFVSQSPAVAASTTLTVSSSSLPQAGQTLSVGGVTFTFVPNGALPSGNTATSGEIALGTDASSTATAIAAGINSHATLTAPAGASASSGGNVITLRANTPGTAGNGITVSSTASSAQLALPASGQLSGGVDLGSLRTETVQSYTIGLDGKISLFGSAGTNRTIGYVTTARFSNPESLQQAGNNLYTFSDSAGTVSGGTSFSETLDTRKAGTNGFGQIQSGALELSNVDLSEEFSDLIISQRSFEANAKVVTTSDEMLRTVVNLKSS